MPGAGFKTSMLCLKKNSAVGEVSMFFLAANLGEVPPAQFRVFWI